MSEQERLHQPASASQNNEQPLDSPDAEVSPPSEDRMSGGCQQVPVGQCPEHGYVTEDSVILDFPNPARCKCSRKLSSVTFANKQRVRELAGEDTASPEGSD